MDQVEYTSLVDALKQVPDPRHRQGRRYRWVVLLSLITAAMASGAHTPQAILRWMTLRGADLLAALPRALHRLPSASTIRRALSRADAEAFERAMAMATGAPPSAPPAAKPTTESPSPPPLEGLALDGKAIRGVGRDGHPCHLVSMVTPTTATVLDQVAVAHKRDQRRAVPALLANRDLTNTLVPLDARHTAIGSIQTVTWLRCTFFSPESLACGM